VALDACHEVGTCDPASGVCSNPAKPEGASCDDGNGCTTADTCQSGSCTGGALVICSALDPCHAAGACSPATGVCSNPVQPDGTACNDGSACTTTDSCQSGVCTGTIPVICVALDGCHSAGQCLPHSGVCTNPLRPDEASCNDQDACTQDDSCQSGSCAGTPKSCPAPDACQEAGTCDPESGACSHKARPDGTACDDGNSCTGNDACQAGTCTGQAQETCPEGQCHGAGLCDPAKGTCQGAARPERTVCNDENPCTTGDACHEGECSGTPVSCAAPDACHETGACNPATGECSWPPRPNGSACTDGDACTGQDSCQGGTCTPGPAMDCGDGNGCTTDSCDGAGRCVHEPRTGGTMICGTGACLRSAPECAEGTENTCIPGQPFPETCNGVDDDCDGLTDEIVCGPASPHSLGFYKKLCKNKPHASGETITPADVACVNDATTFAWVTSVAAVCGVLETKPANDKCRQAEEQFMALLLNRCKGRLWDTLEIQSSCTTLPTVGTATADADALLSGTSRIRAQCTRAQCESQELNTGKALK